MTTRLSRTALRLAVGAAAVALAVSSVPANALTVGPIGVVSPPNDFQLTINTGPNGAPYHTVRHADGTWSAWDSVPDMYFNPGATSSLTQAENGSGSTFLASMFADEIQFLIYSQNSGWVSPTGTTAPISSSIPIVHSQFSPPTTPVVKLAASVVVGGEFHLFAIAGNGGLYEIVRHTDGSWTNWSDLSLSLNGIGSTTELAAASTDGTDTQLVAVAGGKLWHAKRADSASAFSSWGDVFANSSNPGTAEHVAVGGVNGQLQVVVSGNNGTGVYHAIRNATGNWTVFGNVEAAAGNPGRITGVGASGTSAITGSPVLQIAVLTDNGGLFHTLRDTTGHWTSFGNVNAAVPGSYSGTAVTVAGAGE
ncbi:hypothetical protein [Kitasatospora azatica]|uniref:hypothetical protein n=1 Tax=Kitasatospora azatica TaxID=58347 RepID=UPI000567A71A|nr:hypothetical protein [Kitasatospora azatica]